ncbi:MAG: amidohydrolase [Rhodobacteraceae bacterium]|jgi:predicted TIM-barrel fold metal-dependent hydrolase|nr:amidohydrolase [Paracoccaceae bacterium]
MDFIDTHQHLIWRNRFGYGWTAGIPALAEGDFTPEAYRAETKDLGILGTLFMECAVDEADYQAEARHVATRVGEAGLLGLIASCRPETDAGFASWLDECTDLGVNGFRRVLHVVPDDLSQTDTFRTNLRKIGQRGLAFDLCFAARQLSIAEELARACDDQPLVLDHCGVPDIAGGAFDDWARAITRLAALPHMQVKLSGISAYCAPGTASVEVLKPWVEHVLASFGPARVVWGSDWPVVLLGSGLTDWIAMSRALLAGLSPADQAAIGQGNARRLYRL